MGATRPRSVVRGPWPAIKSQVSLARVDAVLCWFGPVEGWMAEWVGWAGWLDGSQHMTIGRVCYRCHGWVRSLEAGPKFLGVSRRGYDFAVMRAPAQSLEAGQLGSSRGRPSEPFLCAGTLPRFTRACSQPCLPYARQLWIITVFLCAVPLSVRPEKQVTMAPA